MFGGSSYLNNYLMRNIERWLGNEMRMRAKCHQRGKKFGSRGGVFGGSFCISCPFGDIQPGSIIVKSNNNHMCI